MVSPLDGPTGVCTLGDRLQKGQSPPPQEAEKKLGSLSYCGAKGRKQPARIAPHWGRQSRCTMERKTRKMEWRQMFSVEVDTLRKVDRRLL